jgi:hypothetical protein
MTVPSDRNETQVLIDRLRDPEEPNGLILRRQAAAMLELYEATIVDLAAAHTRAIRVAAEYQERAMNAEQRASSTVTRDHRDPYHRGIQPS